MANYKVWLTMRDSYGNLKEVDGGTISIDLESFSEEEIKQIEQQLPLEEYTKTADLNDHLDATFATDEELAKVKDTNTLKYSDFFTEAEGGN